MFGRDAEDTENWVYFREGSEWTSRDNLSTITQRNLRALERELGYQFDDQARKAKFGYRPSYLIYGTNPQGEEVVYERREPGHRAAGQTYIWEGGKRHRLGEYGLPLTSVKGRERELIKGYKAKHRLEELEGIDTEEFEVEEWEKVKELLDRIEGRSTSWGEGSKEGLSGEERRELKEFLEGYKRSLE